MKTNINKLSAKQLFCLTVIFNIGSSTLYARGLEAKQDAWIGILLAMVWSVIEIIVYLTLQKKFPNKNLVEIMFALLGKWLAIPLALLLLLVFNANILFILNEFGQLILLTFLPKTPMIVVLVLYMLVSAYIISKGVNTMGRMAELYIILILLSYLAIYILITISGQVDLSNLQPILSKGVKPVLTASYRVLIFPLAETVVFMMFYKYLCDKKKALKSILLGLAVSGVVLALSTISIISVLGLNFAGLAQVPLLKVIKLINVGDIFSNLDALGVMIITIGGLFKITVYFYAIVLIVKTLLKITKTKLLIPIIGILDIVHVSLWFTSFPYAIAMAFDIHLKYVQHFFQIVFPPLLLIIYWVKNINPIPIQPIQNTNRKRLTDIKLFKRQKTKESRHA